MTFSKYDIQEALDGCKRRLLFLWFGGCGEYGKRRSYVTDSGVWDSREKVTHVCVCGAGERYHHVYRRCSPPVMTGNAHRFSHPLLYSHPAHPAPMLLETGFHMQIAGFATQSAMQHE